MARRKGLLGLPIGPVLIFIVGIIVILYILKNKNLLRFGSPVTAGAAIGAAVPGSNVYPVVGPIAPTAESLMTIRSNGTSFRDNQGFDCSICNREAILKNIAACMIIQCFAEQLEIYVMQTVL